MRIGMLTGGGDCPGLNAVIRAEVRTGEAMQGDQVVGFRHGWRGVTDGDEQLTIAGTPVLTGGTIPGRRAPTRSRATTARVLDTLAGSASTR
jgi:6-phosphofructokinase 1